MKKILILLILILSIKSSFVTYGQVWNFDMTKPNLNIMMKWGMVMIGILLLYLKNRNILCFFL